MAKKKIQAPILKKNPKTKLGQLFNNQPSIKSIKYKNFTMAGDVEYIKKKLKIKNTNLMYSDLMMQYMKPEKKYIITGTVKLKIVNSDKDKSGTIFRKYQLPFKAVNKKLTQKEIHNIVGFKLQHYYDKPKFGNSNQTVVGFTVNILEIPVNYEFHKRTKLYSISNLELQLFNKLTDDNIEYDTNCVIDYFFNALQKYRKTITKKLLISQFKICGYDNDGVTIKMFQDVFDKYYPYYGYVLIGPTFQMLYRKKTTKHNLNLTCYINNQHLYPIQDPKVQETINKKLANGKTDFYHYFEKISFTKPNTVKYMETENTVLEDDTIHVLNKNLCIDKFCVDSIKNTKNGIEYIDLDHKTGNIKEFKHPTLNNTLVVAYEDYHARENLVEKINNYFNGKFMVFKNQSFACIAKALLYTLDDIPISHYRTDTLKYLDKYEPKAIIDILKTCKKDDVLQIDYYKQYSSIFYKDFQRKGFYIPVYDFFNTVEKYDNSKIVIGEYFIKQKMYKGVKLFGSFVHYYIVKKLLKMKIIKKSDISHCITTKKYFKPSCFKTFVKLASELCSEKQFKKINNWLNGTLKGVVSRKSRSYFTTDVNMLVYIRNDAEINNKKCMWSFDEKSGYNFLKTFDEKLNNSNTSSFYRATLSCSILQTINLIDLCSKNGEIIKVLTDAVYYIPNKDKDVKNKNNDNHINILDDGILTYDFENKFKNLECEKEEGILNNLGKYFYDTVDNDFEMHRGGDIEFVENEIIKDGKKYVSGGGGLGKSYMVIDRLKDKVSDDILFISTTTKTVIEMRKKITGIIGYIPENWKLMTFAYMETKNQLVSFNDYAHELGKYDLIVVDEIIMTNHNYMRCLEFSNSEKVYLGDYNQLGSICSKYDEKYDMHKYLCKYYHHEIKDFVDGKSRYDKKTYDLINDFLKDGKTDNLKKELNEIDDKKIYDLYIVSTNIIRKEYNKKCCKHFHKKDGFKMNFNRDKCEYYIGKNMPIICVDNDKELKKEFSITNNWHGIVYKIGKDFIKIKGDIIQDGVAKQDQKIRIPKSKFLNLFVPLYACTIHKYQSAKIDKPYAILETQRYHIYNRRLCTKNMLYTALTRTTNMKNIHIYKDNRMDAKFYPEKYQEEYICCNMDHDMYYIYKLTDKDDNISYEIFDKKIKKLSKIKDIKLVYKRKTTKKIINSILDKIECPLQSSVKKFDMYIPTDDKNKFKQNLEQIKKKSKIYILKNEIRYCFYNTEGKREQKKLRVTKKRNIEQSYNSALQQLKKNNLTPEIVNNSKMTLSFI